MSTTKLGLGVAGMLALLLTLGVATYEWRARVEAEQALIATRQNYAAHLADLRAKDLRAEAAEREAVRLAKELDDARAVARRAQAAAAAAPAPVASDPVEEGRAFLARHSEVKQALEDYGRASRRFQFAPMYRALGMTPEQIRLWEAMNGGTMGFWRTGGHGISMPYGTYGVPVSGLERTQKLQEALGVEGVRHLQRFQNIAVARGMAADVAGSLYFTETPLQPAQADQLVQALVESRNAGPAARNSAYDWNAVIAKANAFLSPPQVAVLAGKRATDLFDQALRRPRDAAPAAASIPASPQK